MMFFLPWRIGKWNANAWHDLNLTMDNVCWVLSISPNLAMSPDWISTLSSIQRRMFYNQTFDFTTARNNTRGSSTQVHPEFLTQIRYRKWVRLLFVGKLYQWLQGGPLPVLSRITTPFAVRGYNPRYLFIRPFIGVTTPFTVWLVGPTLCSKWV